MLRLTHLFIGVLMLATVVSALAQDTVKVAIRDFERDTIFVSNPARNVKIMFDKYDEPPVGDIGTKEFGMKVLGCCDVLLKAAVIGGKPTSLYIRYGDTFYNGTIAYKENLPKSLEVLDFRTKKKEVAPVEEVVVAPEPVKQTNLDALRAIGILEGKEKDRFSTIAIMDFKMVFKLADIMQDEHFYYIKLGLYNESKTDYNIDLVDFLFRNMDDQREYNQVQEADKITNQVSIVPAKKSKSLVFAIPTFKITEKWELLVSIREKNGGRKLDLSIPFEKIDTAPKYDPKL